MFSVVNSPSRIPLIAIVGPTAMGKTALSLRLATEFGGEVINADSRQVYRGMNIGTGKASLTGRGFVPHHLIDILDPGQDYNVARYLQAATEAIEGIRSRGRIPFLVGGSGQYVRALLRGHTIPPVPPDPVLRASLAELAGGEGGRMRLVDMLTHLDPVTAAKIDTYNIRRVIRAIEVSQATGRPFSEVATQTAPNYETLTIGLTAPRSVLYQRIDDRVDAMVGEGWLAEVEGLLARGYTPALPSFFSIGYREMAACVAGDLTLADAVAKIKTQTHAFARRQYAWFRLSDPQISWVDISKDETAGSASQAISIFISRPHP